MIPSNTVQEKTGLNPKQLEYLRTLRLIPKPTRIPRAGSGGSTSAYPATIFTRIRVIKFLRSHGLTLSQIARAASGTPFQCPPPAPREKPANDN